MRSKRGAPAPSSDFRVSHMAQIDKSVDQAHQHRTAENIPQRHREQIVKQEIFDSDVWKISNRLADACPERGRRAPFDQQAHRNEIHIRDAMLESSGNKCCDGRNDRQDAIGGGARAERQPNCEAHKVVAQNSQHQRLPETQIAFGIGNCKCHSANRTIGKQKLSPRNIATTAPIAPMKFPAYT